MHGTQENKGSSHNNDGNSRTEHTCRLQLFNVDDLDGINDIFFSVDAAVHGAEGATEEDF